MAVKVGINGFGRIGRSYLRAALATDQDPRAVHDRIINWQPSLQALG